ncbi:MAG: LOG family protein [Gammaproteobacteria bacterium]|nr:LOG family protein [Gammaproteobacteria bacterium]
MPLVLFASEYYQGLLDWLRSTMLINDAIDEKEMDLITITDGIDEVVEIMIKHRKHKKKLIEIAEQEE